MYDNMKKQNLYIQEFVDPESKKHYLFHVYFSIANEWPLEGFHCAECYITDKDPNHNVLVNFVNKAFAPEEFDKDEATDILLNLLFSKLSEGVERFEAIMSHGIKGNELKF